MSKHLWDTFITYFQLMGIGFGFSFVGPCLFWCVPVLAAVAGAKQDSLAHTLKDVLLFILGRFAAYLTLGYIAGVWGLYLKNALSAKAVDYMYVAIGFLLVVMGIYFFFYKGSFCVNRRWTRTRLPGYAGLFLLGLSLGFFPCLPLSGILLDVVLMSKNGLDGLVYMLFFGLGISLSSFLVFGAISGFVSFVPAKVIRNTRINFLFKTLCSLLLVGLGLRVIWRF